MSKLLIVLMATLLAAPPAFARPIHDPPASPPASDTPSVEWESAAVAGGAGAALFSVVALGRRRRGERSSRM